MATITWIGAISTSANNAANWLPPIAVPAAGDVALFDSPAAGNCIWDIPVPGGTALSVDEIIVESGFGQTLSFSTAPRIKGLFLDGTLTTGGGSDKITFQIGSSPNFYGTYKSYAERFVLLGDNAVTTGFEFTFLGDGTQVTKFDDGPHPTVILGEGKFAPDYVAPTGTSGKASFTSLAINDAGAGTTITFAPDGDLVDNDRLKVFSMEAFTTTETTLDFGLATAEYYATSGGFYIPTEGATGYPTGFTAYHRKIVLKANTAGHKCLMADNTFISVEEFEIGDGVVLKGPVDATSQGADIRSIQTPKIRGTWSFSQISQGIYRSPRHAQGPIPKVNGNFYITGKLTVDGLIDPTGMVFTPQATNPEATNPLDTIWINSGTGHLMRGDRDTESTVHYNVRNDSGVTIPIGTPLYSKGEIGGSDRIKVGIADASDPATMPAIGIAMEEMNTNSTKDSNMVLTGVLNENITITGVTERDIIYVAPHGGTAPYLTITRPSAATHLVQNIGVCVRQASANTLQGMYVSAIGRTNDTPNGSYVTTLDDSASHPQSRRLVGGTNITLTDGGGGGDLVIDATGGGITALTGDVTASGSGSVAATIANDSVNDDKLANTTLAKIDGALPKAGGTMTGEIEATTITLNAVPADPATDNKVRIGESGGSSNMLQIQTNDGYLQLGPNNGSYAHFYTGGASGFYFNRAIIIDGGGQLYAYNDGLKLGTGTSASGGTDAITIANGSTDIAVAGTISEAGTLLSAKYASNTQYEKYILQSPITGISSGTTTQLTFGTSGGVLKATYGTTLVAWTIPPTNDRITILETGLYQISFNAFLAGGSNSSNNDWRQTVSSTSGLTGDLLSFRNRTRTDRYTNTGVTTVYLQATDEVFFSVRNDGATYEVGGVVTTPNPDETRTYLDIRKV